MKKSSSTVAVTIPPDLVAALASQPKANRLFRAMPPSHQREYIKWIVEAKKSETRQRRVAQVAEKVLSKNKSA